MNNPAAVRILYTNYKGEIAWRTIIPREGGLHYSTCEWYPGMQWLLEAWDVEKEAYRTFAMKDVKGWVLAVEPQSILKNEVGPLPSEILKLKEEIV